MSVVEYVLAVTIGLAGAAFGCTCLGCAGRPADVYVFEHKLAWASPHSLKVDRMLVAGSDAAYLACCSSLWDAGGEAKLVAMGLSPGALFGQWWDVAMVDKDGRIARRGKIHCQADDTPYCLLEVNTNNAALPAASRNRWLLAIGLVGKFEVPSFDPQKRFLFFAGGGGEIDTKTANWIDVEPVQWDDEPAFTVGVELLNRASCEVRLAERTMAQVMTRRLIRDDTPEHRKQDGSADSLHGAGF